MEEEYKIDSPYYEMTYLDDENVAHLTKIKDKETVSFIKERFTVTDCNYINE